MNLCIDIMLTLYHCVYTRASSLAYDVSCAAGDVHDRELMCRSLHPLPSETVQLYQVIATQTLQERRKTLQNITELPE